MNEKMYYFYHRPLTKRFFNVDANKFPLARAKKRDFSAYFPAEARCHHSRICGVHKFSLVAC